MAEVTAQYILETLDREIGIPSAKSAGSRRFCGGRSTNMGCPSRG